MIFHWRKILITFAALALHATCFAYGPAGHEIVGGIADKLLVNTPAEKKIRALTDGLTLQRASLIADEIRAWDQTGVEDLNAFPHYADHAAIDRQLRDFWRANPPIPEPGSKVPSHHWFHYTDVPVLNPQKYSDGKTGRSEWDVVHMITYCVNVLRGKVSEDNPRKISKAVAVILLSHYVGDIHQPLHVGADYFDQAGHAVDPDKNDAGIEDEGGNTVLLHLFRTSSEIGHRGLKLHGFWDNEAVFLNLPEWFRAASKEETYQQTKRGVRQLIDQLTREEPKSWNQRAGLAIQNYSESWADEILPVAREAHQRLQFFRMHETSDHGRVVMAGIAREIQMPDHIGYADWSAAIVRDELHKAGWRLADLLTKAVE